MNSTTSGNTSKYSKRKRSLDSGSSIVITNSSNNTVKDKKFNSSIGIYQKYFNESKYLYKCQLFIVIIFI